MHPEKTRRYRANTVLKRIYLIAPKHPDNFWSMQGTADMLGARTLMPNSALATLMALTPEGVNIEYVLADENTGTIDFDLNCDLVAITGNTIHAGRIHDLCRIFREKKIPIALGGTYATIDADRCRGLADFHFVGEAEHTWPEFLHDWTRGNAKRCYTQPDYVDMKESPPPDWSLIDANDYVNISVQTSRGCPNQCDFCDVIQYVGRRYRTKPIEHVLTEIQNAYDVGARTIFFSDDNFLGNKAYTRALLKKVIWWNTQQARPLSFSTQITVQVADDPELLNLFAQARFSVLFLGVETVRKESLAEVHKTQNMAKDIFERIRTISRYGIVPFIGLIVGFDHDDETVFEHLNSFLNDTHSPIAGISLLNAPRHTPLYRRLKNENRLIEEDFSGEWQLKTNIIPKQMSRETLILHYRNFFQKIYQPEVFERRLMGWLKEIDYSDQNSYPHKKKDMKQLKFGYRIFMHYLFKADPKVRAMFFRTMVETWHLDPKRMKRFFTMMTQYSHFYQFVKRDLNRI